MRRSALFLGALFLILAGRVPALASPQVYEYTIKHPVYGNIGTFTNVITHTGKSIQVQTAVRVAVKFFGAVVYREESDRSEQWQNGRLMTFHGVTRKDGKVLEVDGQARGSQFVIDGPEGQFVGPAGVQPPNPWSIDCLKSNVMMSSLSGRLFPAQIADQGEETVAVGNERFRTHKYQIDTDRPHTVWFDEQGVPVMLRSIEHGDTITLVLTNYPRDGVNVAAAPPR
jgi:Family of unknown function (DUF6134)